MWNDNSDGQGPWGQNKRRPNSWQGGGNGNNDIEDLIRKGQESLRSMMPRGKGGSSLILLGLVLLAIIWGGSGFYRVKEGEQAVVLRFGKYVKTTEPGLQYHLPYPIEEHIIENVSQINTFDSTRSSIDIEVSTQFKKLRSSEAQPLMLTGDENIVHNEFTVLWYIKDLRNFLFNARSPGITESHMGRLQPGKNILPLAAESVVQEIIAQTPIDDAITKARGEINEKARQRLQALCDGYKLGIQIVEVQQQRVDPPERVMDAYYDVQRARTDKETKVNSAQSYENSIIPVAEGEGIKLVQRGEAYKAEKIAHAKGDTSQFLSILQEYIQAPDITREWMYLDMVQNVLGKAPKVVMDRHAKGNVLPHMALPALESNLKPLQLNKSSKPATTETEK